MTSKNNWFGEVGVSVRKLSPAANERVVGDQ